MVKVKKEADIERILGIKREPVTSVYTNQKEQSVPQTPTQEKHRFIETIVSLKKENQLVHFQLNEKSAELATMVKQSKQKEQKICELTEKLVAITSKLEYAESKIKELEKNFIFKQQNDQKIISGLNAEKRNLMARMKQIQSGALLNSTNNREKSDDEHVYEVERVIDDKLIGGIRRYRVRWHGYGPDDDTWEREDNLFCPSILQEYIDLKSKKK